MKLLTIAFLLFCTICNGQQPDLCQLLHKTFENEIFLKLFQIDTSYKEETILWDGDNFLQNCSAHFTTKYANIYVSKDMPKLNKRFFRLFSFYPNGDSKTTCSIDLANYNAKIFIGIFYLYENGKWVIDHFEGGSTEVIIEGSRPEIDSAVAEANRMLGYKEK